MNSRWAEAKLRDYLEALRTHEVANWQNDRWDSPTYEDAISLEPTVVAVLDAIGTPYEPLAIKAHGGLRAAIDTTIRALAGLSDEAELAANLGPRGPAMSASDLHPLIWGAASAMWSDGHHGQAVGRAATFLSAQVQSLLDRHDVSDAMLMQQAFSDKAPEDGKPRLRWPGDPTDLTVRTMNEGLRGFGPGVFHAIRNPATHSTTDTPEQEALEQLASLSLLARWIDACEVVRA